MCEIITGVINRKSFKTTVYFFSTISFTYYFILFENHKSPTSESMLFVVKERIEVLNLGGGGGDTQSEGIDIYVHHAKLGTIL